MIFYIADAFTETRFGGNPAGVVILEQGEDFPTCDIMKKTAAELRYSETAFIKQLSENEFNIKYFTPAAEVDLCGHATIASFYCLLDGGFIKDNSEYINHTLAGDLNITLSNGTVIMDMATAEYQGTIDDLALLEELHDIMGIPYPSSDNGFTPNNFELLPSIISTGLPDIIFPVPSRQMLADISPDFKRLADLSKRYDVVGVHAFTLDTVSPEITAHCRNFAPLYDIDEEAATGTSNGALTYYLYINNLVPKDGKSIFLQGEAMNRPSKIVSYFTEPLENSNLQAEIRIGGSAAILSKGHIYL